MHIMTRILAVFAGVLTVAAPALATTPPEMIPEPGILGLLVAGGVVGAVIMLRNRRK
jgi:hypothetical protein